MEPPVGKIGWIDLTVPNAPEVRAFYEKVVGWKTTEVGMGDYSDFCMNLPSTGESVAGVCHARGGNVGLPPVWLIYIIVEDLEQSLARCVESGGKIIRGPAGAERHAVIEDPSGAMAALYEAKREASAPAAA